MEPLVEMQLAQFRAVRWTGCTFEVVRRSPDEWRLILERPAGWFRRPQRTVVTFVRPREEWASLWDSPAKQWVDHPDPGRPIGPRIRAADAKGMGALVVSFGGHHALGFARWGFWADALRVENR